MLTFIENKISSKVLVILDQTAYSGTTFIVTALLARLLGAENFGVYSSIILAVYFLMNLSNAIIIQPMQVGLAKFNSSKNYVQFVFKLLVIVLGLFSGILLIGGFVFPQLTLLSKTPLSFLVALLVGWLSQDFLRKLLLAENKIASSLIMNCILAFVQITGVLFLYINNITSISFSIAILSSSFILSAAIGIYLAEFSFSKSFNKHFLRYHIKEGKYFLMTAVLQWWGSNLFVVASGMYLGVAALGAFRLVQSLFGVLNILLQTFENYVLPQAAKIAQTSSDSAKTYLRNVLGKSGLLFGSILLLLFCFSSSFITLLGGSSYSEYSAIVRGMTVLYLVIFLGYATRIPLRMLELNRAFFLGYLISFIFSISSFYILLPNLGLTGVILGLISNQILMILFWNTKLKKRNFQLWK